MVVDLHTEILYLNMFNKVKTINIKKKNLV